MDKQTLYRISGVFVLAVLLAGISGTAKSPAPANEPALEALPEGCTVILVGKTASTDGSVMVTHTADCGVCDWTFHHIPAAEEPRADPASREHALAGRWG